MLNKLLSGLLAGLLLAGGLYAQEDNEAASQAAGADDAAVENEGVGDIDSAETDSPETFVPSEDISEDLSVSFPADI